MLKKKIVMMLAAAMMTLSASSAFAAFADLELIRVVYERGTGTQEFATDLGNANVVAGKIKNGVTTVGTGGTFAGSLPTVTNANNLYVSYWALDRLTNEFWVSGNVDETKAPVAVGTLGFNTFKSGTTNVYGYYNSLLQDANGVVTGAQSNANSHRLKLTANQGALSNAVNIATRPFTEANLASLATGSATSVTQKLYYFANGNTANSKGVAVATITTNVDGSTNIATTATPIPAALYLMGSGLLGLVGLRRRNNA